MRRALELAAKAGTRTRPNPAVGAVIVDSAGTVLGEGYHRAAGEPHAEIEALTDAQEKGREVKGATMFVTLEPCNHTGRTGPCSEAIIKAGISRVVIAQRDPHKEAGGGVEKLREAGIDVETGVLEQEALHLNPAFNTTHMLSRPLVTLKWAMTLDGCTSVPSGDSRWVTSDEARRMVHRRRAGHDAILAGIATVLRDNARLSVRLEPHELEEVAPEGFRPMRIVLDSMLRLSPFSAFVREKDERSLIFCTEEAPAESEERLLAAGAEVARVTKMQGGISLKDLMAELYARGIQSLFVEGGRTVAGSLLAAGFADRVDCWIAPKLSGGGPKHMGPILMPESLEKMSDARVLHHTAMRSVGGEEILIEGWLTDHLFKE